MSARLRWIMLASFASCGVAASLTLAACSGDDNNAGSPDASTDGTTSDAKGDTSTSHPDVNQPDVEQPDTGSGDDGGGGDAADGGGCTLFDAAALDDAAVQEGLGFVKAFGCANCHQSTPADAGIVLSGHNTTIKDGGMIYPPNLTPDPTTGLGCWTDTQITNAILNGIDDQGQTLCVMPKFSTKGMDGGAALAIAQFLRSLPAVQNQVPDSVCPVTDGGADGGSDAGDASTD